MSATRRKPSHGSTHWSCRKLASALDVNKDAVHRAWQEAGLKPHRFERYMASDDSQFETKAADIVGLYLNPPQHEAVFCIDEKTAIQALDRLDPVLPFSPDAPNATVLSITATGRSSSSDTGAHLGRSTAEILLLRSWGFGDRGCRGGQIRSWLWSAG